MHSKKFGLNAESTKTSTRRILESTYKEPIHPGFPLLFRDLPISKMSARHVEVLRDRKLPLLYAADARVKTIRSVFKFGRSKYPAIVGTNPATEVELFREPTDGHHTWTDDELAQFFAYYREGSKERLALALLLYTGARVSDVVTFGPQTMTKRSTLKFTPQKTGRSSKISVELPIHPILAKELARITSKHAQFLLTNAGAPFTKKGFSNWFKKRCRQAGLNHCSAHGVRKATARIAAENGATEAQLMAMMGWTTPAMAVLYIKKANALKLAAAGIEKLTPLSVADFDLSLITAYRNTNRPHHMQIN